MKKIISSFFIAGSLLFANSLTGNLQTQINQQQQIPQKQLKTYKDYKELENILKKAISYGDYTKAVALAGLYMQNFTFKTKKVKANFKKAKRLLKLALNHKVPLAAFYLAMMEDPIQSELDLYKAIQMAKNVDELQFLIMIYDNNILDNLYKNKIAVQKAIDLTIPILKLRPNPKIEFMLAHLYYILQDYKKANLLLNDACNSGDKKVLQMCFNDPYVKKKEISK